MFKIYPEYKSLGILLISICIVILWGSQDVGCDDADHYLFEDKNNTFKDDGVKYLQALETFDKSNDSCLALAKSIKGIFKFIDFNRQDELSALLYAYPHFRRDIFPVLQYKRVYNDPGNELIGRSDALIHRSDGLLFSIRSFLGIGTSDANLRVVEEDNYKGIEGTDTELVLLTLSWTKSKAPKNDIRNRTLTANFRFDNLNGTRVRVIV